MAQLNDLIVTGNTQLLGNVSINNLENEQFQDVYNIIDEIAYNVSIVEDSLFGSDVYKLTWQNNHDVESIPHTIPQGVTYKVKSNLSQRIAIYESTDGVNFSSYINVDPGESSHIATRDINYIKAYCATTSVFPANLYIDFPAYYTNEYRLKQIENALSW